MPNMRAKLKLTLVSSSENAEVLKFIAVGKSGDYPEDGSDDDNTYAKFSPQASLDITIANPNLIGKFKPGEKYYVDFSLAE